MLSSNDGESFFFFESETASHAELNWSEGAIEKRARSIDSIREEKQWATPDFIKIHVQGFELEVLKGAKKSPIALRILFARS